MYSLDGRGQSEESENRPIFQWVIIYLRSCIFLILFCGRITWVGGIRNVCVPSVVRKFSKFFLIFLFPVISIYASKLKKSWVDICGSENPLKSFVVSSFFDTRYESVRRECREVAICNFHFELNFCPFHLDVSR